jgi:hypothetical protein
MAKAMDSLARHTPVGLAAVFLPRSTREIESEEQGDGKRDEKKTTPQRRAAKQSSFRWRCNCSLNWLIHNRSLTFPWWFNLARAGLKEGKGSQDEGPPRIQPASPGLSISKRFVRNP